jgi:parallel beta-helix repeat protein
VNKSICASLLIAATGFACVSRTFPEPGSVGNKLYVATTGLDSNPGSEAAPFRTIQHAARLARPGTSVHVAAGTYYENVTTRAHGTPEARIRFISDTKWEARIVGSGTEGAWTNHADYIDIVGFDISGTGRLGILNLASHTLIQGNHVHDLTVSGGCTSAGGAGINNANYRASDGDIIGNVVHDIGVPGSCLGIHGIYVTNLRSRIFNNIVYRASSWGIHLWHAADNVTIANNTIFENGSAKMGGGIVIGVGDSPGGKTLTNTKVINNIVYNNPAKGIIEFCYPRQDCIGPGNVVANNLVYGSTSAVIMKVGQAIGTIVEDPQFIDYQAKGSGDYRLKRTSPAIQKGLAIFAPTTDIEHVPRPRQAAPDIGAYESR